MERQVESLRVTVESCWASLIQHKQGFHFHICLSSFICCNNCCYHVPATSIENIGDTLLALNMLPPHTHAALRPLPCLPHCLDHADHHNEWRKCVTVHLALRYSCGHSSVHIWTPLFFSECHCSDKGTLTASTLIPTTRLCLSLVHDKVSNMKGYGLWGNGEREWFTENMSTLYAWLCIFDRPHIQGILNRLSYWFIFTPVCNPRGLMRRVHIPCQYDQPKSCDWCLHKNKGTNKSQTQQHWLPCLLLMYEM